MPAVNTTAENPKFMAMSVASMTLSTEAQPFTPQAQGTRAGAPDQTRDSPRGNGIPMKKARGAIRPSDTRILATSVRCRSASNTPGKIERRSSDTAMMAAMESWIADNRGPRPGRPRRRGLGNQQGVARQLGNA